MEGGESVTEEATGSILDPADILTGAEQVSPREPLGVREGRSSRLRR